jgi:hypothetical protein
VLLHTPAEQESTVHGLLSLQSAPVLHDSQPAMGVFTQPLSGLHESVVHALPSLQLGAVPGEQTPFWHVSFPLHTDESRHEVPFATLVYWQPVVVLHESVVHTFESLQIGGVPSVQLPSRQISGPLQKFPSEHEVPLATFAAWQPLVALHESVVHGLPSLQASGVPGVQAPAWHVSSPLHTVPSLQDVPLGALAVWQPLAVLHVSSVHGLPSLQTRAVPAVHVPL